LFTTVNFAVTSTVTFSVSGNFINIALVSTGITQFSVIDTQLNNFILGLKLSNTSVITGGTTASITGSNVINLNIDNYLNMHLENVPTDNNHNFNGVLCSFKVSLNGVYGTIIYNNDENVFKQTVYISDENYILRELRISFYDRFGNAVINNGLDYSFSLEIKNYID
jgi:predicted aspartyl protease